MNRTIFAITLTFGLVVAPTPAAASVKGWDQASSVARTGLVAVALGLPAVRGDWRGLEQSGLAIGSAGLVTYGLKQAFPKTRPDGSDQKSFPSGHTSVSFAAAVSLEKRYGWEVGIPAIAVASFVGLARVKAKKHFVSDVVVGAAIGSGAGWLLTGRRDQRVQWLPWGDAHGGGVDVALRF